MLPLADNFADDKFEYEVHVHTGFSRKSGTKSNVFCQIFGTEGDTGIRKLKDNQREVTKRLNCIAFVESCTAGVVNVGYISPALQLRNNLLLV